MTHTRDATQPDEWTKDIFLSQVVQLLCDVVLERFNVLTLTHAFISWFICGGNKDLFSGLLFPSSPSSYLDESEMSGWISATAPHPDIFPHRPEDAWTEATWATGGQLHTVFMHETQKRLLSDLPSGQ